MTFQDGQNSTSIELPLDSSNIHDSQVSVHLELTEAEWEENSDDDLRFGLKQTEIVILNDIGKLLVCRFPQRYFRGSL